ncbi:MAG TPA: VOC family protein [Acidimicrobiales bacterium]|jgi:catechol 2,3-dioxygenase-like lactoylglutathione lyase family enzyme|nr:VOC family protein [Acidimicrobiales bacterium]
MGVQLTKDSIDLGIVTNEPEKSLAFYRDLLGFTDLGQTPMPGGTMQRLGCGSSVIKLVTTKKPTGPAPGGGIQGAQGYRYWTISVSNLAELVAQCEGAGVKVVVPITELAPGVVIAIVEDPDGNWVEFLGS